MFTFENRDEGFMVFDGDGRGVASVDCCEIGFDHNPKFKVPERVVTPWPQEKWRLHFTARKLTPPEIGTLLKELSEQSL